MFNLVMYLTFNRWKLKYAWDFRSNYILKTILHSKAKRRTRNNAFILLRYKDKVDTWWRLQFFRIERRYDYLVINDKWWCSYLLAHSFHHKPSLKNVRWRNHSLFVSIIRMQDDEQIADVIKGILMGVQKYIVCAIT